MTEFGDTLAKAIDKKNNDINSFVWKSQGGIDIRMMDMSESSLQRSYNHVNDMLYNKNPYSVGKFEVRKNIHKAWDACNAELFKRFLLYECNVGFKTNKDVLDYVIAAKKQYNAADSDFVRDIITGLPTVYEKVTINDLLNACFDKLEPINKKMISDKFILSQGIWLTDNEKKELTEYNPDGSMRKWLDVVKERLFLKDIRLRIDQKGFSYSEFRALIQMDKLPRVSTLPSDTLKLLRDKVLLLLDSDLNYHIDRWLVLKEQIEKVAEYKGINLYVKNY